MSDEKVLGFTSQPLVPGGDLRLQAIALMYHRYAATREEVPSIAADVACRFARYVLDHQSDLTMVSKEIEESEGRQ